MSQQEKPHVNIYIFGDANVGKTSMLKRGIDSIFSEEYTANTETRIIFQEGLVNDIEVDVAYMDTKGGVGISSYTSKFFNGVDCCVLTYDVSNMQTFESMKEMKSAFSEASYIYDDKFPFIVVGLKADLECQVPIETVTEWCNSNNIKLLFTLSSKNDEGNQYINEVGSVNASKVLDSIISAAYHFKEKDNLDNDNNSQNSSVNNNSEHTSFNSIESNKAGNESEDPTLYVLEKLIENQKEMNRQMMEMFDKTFNANMKVYEALKKQQDEMNLALLRAMGAEVEIEQDTKKKFANASSNAISGLGNFTKTAFEEGIREATSSLDNKDSKDGKDNCANQ